ncbi:AAA family ATPase [Nocardia sp. NPDC004168]|uniref:helix-turn-helix transcriptional regulator n=1 Tax=Nocardia sp. NPDC004168 TaxID=3154452 RepID=UPI0033A92D56
MAGIGAEGASGVTLVGRDSELRCLDKVLANARAGSAVAVAVVGEPGIGKTRLLSELCTRAAATGFNVFSGRGTELERDVPFGLLVDALDEGFGSLDPRILTDLGPDRTAELAAVLPSLSGYRRQLASRLEVERFEFHHAIRATLAQLTSRKPIALTLDDVHWADPASTELISYLLRRPVSGMALTLAYRRGRLPEPLMHTLTRTAREQSLCQLQLAPLTLIEAAQALGRQPDSPELQTLYFESGGNPFYLEQLARTSHTVTHQLTHDITGTDTHTGIPSILRNTITHELATITTDALITLQAGAVAGDPFGVDLVTAITDFDVDRVRKSLDELLTADLVRPTTTPSQFRFRHPILRRAVYDQTLPGRRYSAHKNAAQALAQRGAPIGTQAHHIELSASPGDEQAITTLAQAAQTILPRAPAAAARWLQTALRLLPLTSGPEQRLPLLITQATALASCGQLHLSRTTLQQALQLIPTHATAERARITTMIARADHGLGHAETAHHLIRTALDQTPAASPDSIELELELAENHLMRGRWQDAIDSATRAHAHAEALGDDELLVVAKSSLAVCISERGDVIRAQQLVESVVESLDGSNLTRTPELLETLANLVFAEIYLGLLPAAARHADHGLAVSRATGHGHAFGRFALGATSSKILLGRLGEARREADATLEAALLLDNDQLRVSAESVRCWVETASGELPTALAAGRAAVQAADRSPNGRYVWMAHACYGMALIEAGEFERGRLELLRGGGPALSDISPAARPFWLQALVTAELAVGRTEAAEVATQRIEEAAKSLPSRVGHAHHARALMFAARGDFEAAAASARMAGECFDAIGTRVWAASARLEAGRALARTGDLAMAVRELELAYGVLRETGARRLADDAASELRTLGRRVRRSTHAVDHLGAADLTEREREIADRVAQGYTNREIATDLFISPKTVEKHLSRVFTKIGTSSRAGVAAAMHGIRSADGKDKT